MYRETILERLLLGVLFSSFSQVLSANSEGLSAARSGSNSLRCRMDRMQCWSNGKSRMDYLYRTKFKFSSGDPAIRLGEPEFPRL